MKMRPNAHTIRAQFSIFSCNFRSSSANDFVIEHGARKLTRTRYRRIELAKQLITSLPISYASTASEYVA
jgi:hypothetical protein